jgi:hypothetical protein
MQPEVAACHGESGGLIDHLASQLYDLAGGQEVRVIEALAAAFANRWRDGLDEAPCGLCEPLTAAGFERDVACEVAGRLAICRRVARRALRGSLVDPTRGRPRGTVSRSAPLGRVTCCRSGCSVRSCSIAWPRCNTQTSSGRRLRASTTESKPASTDPRRAVDPRSHKMGRPARLHPGLPIASPSR